MGVQALYGSLEEVIIGSGSCRLDLLDILLGALLLEEVSDSSAILDDIVDAELEVSQAEGFGDIVVGS
jgi:hypothetical protein